MKKLFLLFVVVFSVSLFAQDDYVSIDNQVYNFLQRMEALHIIKGYNSFEIPKPRKDIAGFIKQVITNRDKLDAIDKKILKDLEVEFEFDLYGTLHNQQKMIGGGGYDLFSQDGKYLYFYNDPHKASFFVNLLGQGQVITQNDFQNKSNLGSAVGVIGGEIRGTFLDHFGFSLSGTDGLVKGNKEVARLRTDIRDNFKFNLDTAAAFFDETTGYLTADYDMFRLKFGTDKMRIGYGPMRSILDDNAPPFTYLSFNIHYKFFDFSYFHGKLLGETEFQPDSINGGLNYVHEKYIGYHRIGFDLTDAVNFGVGEMVIYGDRGLDLSYLNPFAFYKSVEHANQDRDNSFLFFDFTNKSIEGLKIYSTLLIDDIDFSKLGTGWYGNETLFDLGIFSSNLYKIIPADIKLELTTIDPYVHTHRTGNTNFTNLGYDLGSGLKPNSVLMLGEIDYRLSYRLSINGRFQYIIHGANPVLTDGTIINVGGDEALGHRTFDSNVARLLDGDLEYSRITSLLITYEPVKQYFITLNLTYLNESLQNSVRANQLQSFFTVSVKF